MSKLTHVMLSRLIERPMKPSRILCPATLKAKYIPTDRITLDATSPEAIKRASPDMAARLGREQHAGGPFGAVSARRAARAWVLLSKKVLRVHKRVYGTGGTHRRTARAHIASLRGIVVATY